MILQNWQGVYIHIERRELKAGDDVNGNNVMGGMLIIEAMCVHHALMMIIVFIIAFAATTPAVWNKCQTENDHDHH